MEKVVAECAAIKQEQLQFFLSCLLTSVLFDFDVYRVYVHCFFRANDVEVYRAGETDKVYESGTFCNLFSLLLFVDNLEDLN